MEEQMQKIYVVLLAGQDGGVIKGVFSTIDQAKDCAKQFEHCITDYDAIEVWETYVDNPIFKMIDIFYEK